MVNKRLLQYFCYIALVVLCGCDSEVTTLSSGLGRMRFDIQLANHVYGNVDDPILLKIESDNGLYTHTWNDASEFPERENFYVGGYKAEAYTGTIGSEGFDCSCYYGSTDFRIEDNALTDVNIICSLSQAVIKLQRSIAESSGYGLGNITIHTAGHDYVTFTATETRPAFLLPGKTYLYIDVIDGTGKSVTLTPDIVIDTKEGEQYDVEVGIDASNTLKIVCKSASTSLNLTPGLFSTQPPTIECQGFKNGEILNLIEGYPASLPVKMVIDSKLGIESLILTSLGSLNNSIEINSEIDILNKAEELKKQGLVIEQLSDERIEVDFTNLLEHVSVYANSNLDFILQARDKYSRVSELAVLRVNIKSVEFSVTDVSPVVLGINRCKATLRMNVEEIEPNDITLKDSDDNPIEIISSDINTEDNTVMLEFNVAEGTKPVTVKLYYLDVYKLDINTNREVPTYQMVVDPFATRAIIRIKDDNHAVTEALTRFAKIRANGKEVAILSRDEDSGTLIISGLTPDTRYMITSEVISGCYTPQVEIRSEKALTVPEGDFEDYEDKIDYKHLASGGVYSSTSFPIFNQQNFVDVAVSWPRKHWASINDKTFCTKASNHNTWYMQPSAMIDFNQAASGSKSVKITSVGWSLNGEEISPYTQPTDSYKPYNNNVPKRDKVSAGRLFLGEYTFDPATMTEVYNEGVAFTSRPSALNGFFMYLTDTEHVNDCGLVIVQLINDQYTDHPLIIASAEMTFSTAPDFNSFNLPLEYHIYNVPATKLKIMFASSVGITDGISDMNVPVSADVSNAKFVGSTLWIDNLSFSY